jgi:hypothetical protein
VVSWAEKDVADWAARTGCADVPARAPENKPAERSRRGQNKTEAAYTAYLELHKRVPLDGKRLVIWYAFEALKVRIGDRCWLTPDFLVQYDNGELELHDTKGRKGNKYFATDDAIVKARAVGRNFPVPIYFVFPIGQGEWGKARM